MAKECRRRVHASRPNAPRGVTVLETIVALPVLFIAILAIVELGLLSRNQGLVQAASRAAADVASSLELPISNPMPPEIADAVDAILQCEGIESACIRVEHNTVKGGPYVLTTGTGGDPPPSPAPANDPYVRVSVCVENSQLAPNLLKSFCINLAGYYSQRTTTRCR